MDNNHPFGIASAGRELSNGTTCNFKLKYRLSVGNGNVQYAEKLSSCTGKCIITIVAVFCDAKNDLCFSWCRV